MNSARRGRWPVLILVLGGITLGGLYRRSVSAGPSVVVDPASGRVTVDPIEGDEVAVPLSFRNRSSSPVSIVRAVASCGCMALVTPRGDINKAPIVVSPGEAVPWRVVIRTLNRSGEQAFRVGFDYDPAAAAGTRSP